MTAPLLANKATFPLRSHLLFPTVYQCALIHLFLISHLRPECAASMQFFAVMYLFVCALPEAPARVQMCDCCVRRWWSWSVERARAGQQEAEGNQLCSANTYCSKIQVIRVCVCVCALMSVAVCLRWERGAAVCVCVCYIYLCVVMKGSIYCSCCRVFFSSSSSCFSSLLFLDW